MDIKFFECFKLVCLAEQTLESEDVFNNLFILFFSTEIHLGKYKVEYKSVGSEGPKFKIGTKHNANSWPVRPADSHGKTNL